MSSNEITLIIFLLEIVFRLLPTKRDISIFSNLKKLMLIVHDVVEKIIPNNKDEKEK